MIKNWDKCAENYSADADLSVLMDSFFEDIIYTVLAYTFSFVLLLALTSQFFVSSHWLFILNSSNWAYLRAREKEREKTAQKEISLWESAGTYYENMIQTVTMINIFGLPLIYSSRLLLPVVLEPAICLTLYSTLPPGLLSFCSILLKSCLALFHSYTLHLFITHRPSWWVWSSAPFTWGRKVAWASHLLSPKTAQPGDCFPACAQKLHHPPQTPFLQKAHAEGFTLTSVNILSSTKIYSTKHKAEKTFRGGKSNLSDFYLITLILLW